MDKMASTFASPVRIKEICSIIRTNQKPVGIATDRKKPSQLNGQWPEKATLLEKTRHHGFNRLEMVAVTHPRLKESSANFRVLPDLVVDRLTAR
ncbi:protein of unknown function [Cupriavidus taiwanensis]|uniref:Uncharacterized protein n=1 Tax=Cupriavidus taiwanensis TaxID=164546 RepID=A0A375IDD3_9BURK|nr:protein of unknown function [Cupriavidus taiwanensis]